MPQASSGNTIASSAQIVDGIITGADMANGAVDTAQIANGAVTEAKQTLADNTTGDVATTRHGYAPKLPNDTTKYLDGVGTYKAVLDSELSTSDITTNDVSTTKHGFCPKLPNNASQFLNGVGSFAAVSSKIAEAAANTVIQSTAAETNIISQSITGGTLGTSGAIKVRVYFKGLGRATGLPTFRFKYGATTLATLNAADPGGTVTNYYGIIECFLGANGATNAQTGYMQVQGFKAKWTSNTTVDMLSIEGDGTATEDSTAAKTLVVSIQHGNSSANETITIVGYEVSSL